MGYSLAASFCISPSWAVTSDDIVYAIKKGGILPARAQVAASVGKDRVAISTYRNPQYNPTDYKIDAAMMAKTISDIAGPEIVNVTVQFYGTDRVSYDEVSLTKGDIAAFSSGQLGKEQFLASLNVRSGKLETATDRVTRKLESGGSTNSRVTVTSADAVDISIPLDSWVSDEDAKLEALKVALTSSSALPAEATKLTVSFVDPDGKGDVREVTFRKSDLPNIWKAVQSSLESATLTKKTAPVEIGNLTVALGPHREERERLLVQLKELDKLGVGIVPFIRAFLNIEGSLTTLSDAALVDSINKLSSSLAEQEKAFKAAKTAKAGKPRAGGADINPKMIVVLERVVAILTENNRAAEAKPFDVRARQLRANSKVPIRSDRWALGNVPIIPGEVLANPNQFVQRMERELK
jgi:hypothetical protein